jgi:hypothetical protein
MGITWKINVGCLSLSPFISFQSRFVTYLLTFPRSRLFKGTDILPVPHQYIFSLIFVVDKLGIFQANWKVHALDKRSKLQLHRPTAYLSCLYSSVFHASTNIFSSLPSTIWSLTNDKLQFNGTLQRYITAHNFYLLDKFQANRHKL